MNDRNVIYEKMECISNPPRGLFAKFTFVMINKYKIKKG